MEGVEVRDLIFRCDFDLADGLGGESVFGDGEQFIGSREKRGVIVRRDWQNSMELTARVVLLENWMGSIS